METIGYSNFVLGDAIAIVAGTIVFFMLMAITIRLKRIIRNTHLNSKDPIIHHFLEAKIYEASNQKSKALEEYYRCSYLLRPMMSETMVIDGHRISRTIVSEKIKELGGNDLSI